MDLKKQSVRQNIEKAKEFLQITLDDDYIINSLKEHEIFLQNPCLWK